jgi:hypothetical protein
VVHKFFCIGYGGVDKPHIQHEEKTDQKEGLPAPYCFQVVQGIVTGEKMVYEEYNEREHGELDGEAYQCAVPGNKCEYQQ